MKSNKYPLAIGSVALVLGFISIYFTVLGFQLNRISQRNLEDTLLKSEWVIEEQESLIRQLRCNPFYKSGSTLLVPPLCELPPVTQGYGINSDAYGGMNMKGHNGIDWLCEEGDPIRAAHNGEVFSVWTDADGFHGYGNHVKLRGRFDSYNGLETVYAHLSKTFVRNGDTVRQGQLIGYCGNTGKSSGDHLHFGIRFLGFNSRTTGIQHPYEVVDGDNGYFGWVDPLLYL